MRKNMKKRKVIAVLTALVLAGAMVWGGGTLAYYTWTSNEAQNVAANNYNWVGISETAGDPETDSDGNIKNTAYEIVPGTSQDKDPVVTVSYSLDSYVYLEVTDDSGGMITWAIANGWEPLTVEYDTEGNITHAVYYQLVETTGTETGTASGIDYWIQELQVLENDQISYSSSIGNDENIISVDPTSGVPTVNVEGYSLNFQAYIIQADIAGSSLPTSTVESAMECWYALAGQSGLGVAAINGVLHQDVAEAILAVEEGGTVTLLSNTAATTNIGYNDEVPQEYTINLNGFTLSLSSGMQLSAREVVRVTEANSADYPGYPIGYVIRTENLDTDVTIENGTIEIASSSGYLRYESGTVLTLNDVTFTNTASTTAQRAIQYYVSDNTTTNTITVSNCTFDNTYIDICGSSNNKPYEVTATFTDCDFSAKPGNGGGCVKFDSYIYGDFTFTNCSFEVTGGGNANGAIVVNSSSSYCVPGSVNLTLDDVTITCTSTGTYVWNTYTPYPVRISNTSVVNVTDNKSSVYSYTLDGSPVTYDGTAITVPTGSTASEIGTSLVSAISSGNSLITLPDDCGTVEVSASSLSSAITDEVEIDLNGNTLTTTDNGILDLSGELTISNGTVVLAISDSMQASMNPTVSMYTGSSLTLENVELSINAPINIEGGTQTAELSIINSTINSTGYYCISTNAANTTSGESVIINIENSELNAVNSPDNNGDATAILFNIPGTLNISDSTITGSRQGVIVRCGTANITDSKITTTGAILDSTYGQSTNPTRLSGTWGSGNEVPAAALVVGNYSSTAYCYDAIVALENVTLTVSSHTDTIPAIYAACYNSKTTTITGAATTDTVLAIYDNNGTISINGTAVTSDITTITAVSDLT